VKVGRALISVSDKTGLEVFVRALHEQGVEILSTGGTASFIRSLDIPVVDISTYTGFPELMDGRVKTLHPRIHGGLLALRDNEEHIRQAEEYDIPFIDMVVVNLYPFIKTVSKAGTTLEDAIENIDIGGPSMLRSAAKNYRSVAVVSSPAQYEKIVEEMEKSDRAISENTSRHLALEVFRKTSEYDNAISKYLSREFLDANDPGKEGFPEELEIRLSKVYSLRYGENPHQGAAFYRDAGMPSAGLSDIEQLQGKQLSFNNIMDINAAVQMTMGFGRPSVSIVKHNNPCGIAMSDTLEKAYMDALDCDRLSAFGSIMSFNKTVREDLARLILDEADFVECIIAPDFGHGALDIFGEKKNLRILRFPEIKKLSPREKDMKKVLGGMLVQDLDAEEFSADGLEVVTSARPCEEMMDSLIFAWKVCKFVKSNAIVLCQGTKTVGIGAGQMSRVDSVITAIRKAGTRAKGSVLASDAFFPMPDSIEEAGKAGISAIIQPGGSIRDKDVIAACDRSGIPMVFTGTRHFRH